MASSTTSPDPGAAGLHVRLVTPERELWSGKARFVVARSSGGDLGVLPGHEHLLAVLGIGPVRIERYDQDALVASVDGGFLSVAHENGVTRVDVLAEHVVLDVDQHGQTPLTTHSVSS